MATPARETQKGKGAATLTAGSEFDGYASGLAKEIALHGPQRTGFATPKAMTSSTLAAAHEILHGRCQQSTTT